MLGFRVAAVEVPVHGAQSQLVDKERLAAVGEVVVGLHHAILNPLTGTLGALQVLTQDPALPPRTLTALADAQQELQRVAAVVHRLTTLRRAAGTENTGHGGPTENPAPGVASACPRRPRARELTNPPGPRPGGGRES